MRDDLLHAQAAVDWAVSNLPSFQERLYAWIAANIHIFLKETEPQIPHNVLVAVQKEPLPLTFNVEAGAYINVIRSSLDILAVALARRATA